MFIFEHERDKEEMRFKRASDLKVGDVVNLTGARVVEDIDMSTKGISCTLSNPDGGSNRVEEYAPWRRVSVYGKEKREEKRLKMMCPHTFKIVFMNWRVED